MNTNRKINFYPFALFLFLIASISCSRKEVIPALTVTDVDGNLYNTVNVGPGHGWLRT